MLEVIYIFERLYLRRFDVFNADIQSRKRYVLSLIHRGIISMWSGQAMGEGALGNKKSRGVIKRGGFSFSFNCSFKFMRQ